MPASTSRLAYEDCFNVYEQALDADKGVRIKFSDYGDAMNFRTRLHYARTIERKDNKEIYAVGERLHGRSVYDVIRCTIRNIEGSFYIYLEKLATPEVESIEDEPVPEPVEEEAKPTPAIDRRL